MMKACFDSSGSLLWLARHDGNQVAEDGQTIVDVHADADVNNLFWNGTAVVSRPTTEFVADRTVIASDGADGATFANLPQPCVLAVNGVRVTVDKGSFILRSNSPGRFHVELVDAHRSLPVLIRADTSLALMNEVRVERDARLAACDWTQAVDAPLDQAQKTAWADYRQALRDLPASQSQATIETVVFPDVPK